MKTTVVMVMKKQQKTTTYQEHAMMIWDTMMEDGDAHDADEDKEEGDDDRIIRVTAAESTGHDV